MSISNNVNIVAKLAAIKAAVRLATGEDPIIIDRDNFFEIRLTPTQKSMAERYLINQLSAEPGEIRFNALEVLTYPVMKVYGKWIALGLIGVYLLGRNT